MSEQKNRKVLKDFSLTELEQVIAEKIQEMVGRDVSCHISEFVDERKAVFDTLCPKTADTSAISLKLYVDKPPVDYSRKPDGW